MEDNNVKTKEELAEEARVAEAKKVADAKSKAVVSKKKFTLVTTRPVSFIVDGVHSDGTSFDFNSQGEFNDAKRMLVANYGKEVIKES
jgi:hypothetical protein